jgi:ATP-binding cassette, subfamily B, bacterial
MERIRSFWRSELKLLWQHTRWMVVLIWRTDRHLLLVLVAIMLALSLTPAGLALTLRGLVNEVAAIISGQVDTVRILMLWLALGLAITLVETVGNFANAYCSQRLHDELNLRITYDILDHASRLDVAQFEDPRFQDLLERARQNTADRFSYFVTNVLTAVTNLTQVISLTLILVIIEPIVTLLLLPIAIPYLWFQWRMAQTRFQKDDNRATRQRWNIYFTHLMTRHEYVPEVKLLRLSPLLKEKFQKIMVGFRDEDRQIYRRTFIGNALFAIISVVVFYLTFARVALRVLDGGLTIGDVAIYGGATGRLRLSLEYAIVSITTAMEQTLHVANLIAFFAIEPQAQEHVGLVPPDLTTPRGSVRFENVTFRYPSKAVPALQDVSFTIHPGETMAIVGENGAGKTTLVKLIARLYEPDEGNIFLDNYNVRDLSPDYLRHQVAFVFQRFLKFEGTVADNIAYGDWERLLDNRDAVVDIARQAGIDEMIMAMPDGYDTILGLLFSDHTLSGGQWQKLALARAFARQSTLLILDEPTSNLDARSEYRIFSRFQEMAAGRTALLISHRFSTVSMADRIIVLDQGRVVECGSHQELLAAGGTYTQLYNLHRLQYGRTHTAANGHVEIQPEPIP